MNTGGIALLSRQHPITNEEFLKLIECRWKLIRPHLQRFPLPKLGEFDFLTSERTSLRSPLWVFHPLAAGKKFSLDTKGLFFCGRTKRLQGLPYHKVRFVWGITTSGQWLLARVAVCDEVDPHSSRGSTHEVAKSVHIGETSLPKLLTTAMYGDPREVWWALGNAVREYTVAQIPADRRLLNIIQTEELIFRHIPL